MRYENSGHDEITILGDRFNEMMDKTNQLIEQVYLSEIRSQKELLSRKNARLHALLTQINPHFLYNTLDIIRWEAMYEAHGESRVTRMIEKFSRLCRMSMHSGSSTIPLTEGLEHASLYLDVINFRHNDKIRLEQTTEADADALYIPRFLLQPLMENAVVHAFDNASSGYVIRIRSFLRDDCLHICVSDNGRGMSGQEVAELQSRLKEADISEDNIGLINVHQRIRLLYGDSFGLNISSVPDEGTTVEIVLPVRTVSENTEENSDDLSGAHHR